MTSSGKLSSPQKIVFSLGQIGYNVPGFFLPLYIFTFYAPSVGTKIVPYYLVGLAVGLGTIVQGIANPLIGHWSDRATYRTGRRRFFIITGTIPLSILFFLIWVPVSTSYFQAALLLIYSVGFNFFFAYVVLPYLSLIPELASTIMHRVKLTTIMGYFAIIGIVLANIIPLLTLETFGYGLAGLIISVIMLTVFLIVFFTTEEVNDPKKRPASLSLTDSIRETFRNRTFNRYILSYLFFQFGFYALTASIGYIIEDLVMPGNSSYKTWISLATLFAVAFAVLFSPLLYWYTAKKGEKKSFILFTFILAVSIMLVPVIGFLPIADRIPAMLVIMVFTGMGLSSYFILPNAIISEIIDEDEEKTGFRREAMYFGIQGILERIPSGISLVFVGLWMQYLYGPTGNQVYIMLMALIGGLSVLVTSISFRIVPLKEHRKKAQDDVSS